MRKHGNEHDVSATLGFALLEWQEGDEPRARARLEAALSDARAIGAEQMVGSYLWSLGWLACDRGDLHSARSLQAEALKTTWASGAFRFLHRSFVVTGMIMLREQKLEEAALLWGAAEVRREERKNPREVVMLTYEESLAALQAGLDEARLAEAWQRGRDMSLPDAVAYALEALESP